MLRRWTPVTLGPPFPAQPEPGERMAAKRLSVRKVREVLRLAASGMSRRQIGQSLRISHNTAAHYCGRPGRRG